MTRPVTRLVELVLLLLCIACTTLFGIMMGLYPKFGDSIQFVLRGHAVKFAIALALTALVTATLFVVLPPPCQKTRNGRINTVTGDSEGELRQKGGRSS